MIWNIGRKIKCLEISKPIKRMFKSVDLVVLSETGHTDADRVYKIPLFECVSCSMRPHDAFCGGVAVFVKKTLKDKVSLIKDLPEFGMSWFRIQGILEGGKRDIYACACYIPPKDSSYYKHEAGELNRDAHFECLERHITEFKAKGEIMVLGDLNARTGKEDDRGVIVDPREWELSGAPIPTDLLEEQGRLHAIRERASMDNVHDSVMGQRLLQLCIDQGLVILNGRLPGDAQGAHTFSAIGRDAKSLVDYFITSPPMIFDNNGSPKTGTTLTVATSTPVAPGGSKFDHLPVTLVFEIENVQSSIVPKPRAHGVMSYVWHNEQRQNYARTLRNDAEIGEALAKIPTSSAAEAEAILIQAVKSAIGKVNHNTQERSLKLIVPRGGPKAHGHGHRNLWYDNDCKEAKRAYEEAEQLEGVESMQAKTAYKEYKRIVGSAKARWENERESARAHKLRANPRKFWAAYKATPKQEPLDIHSWTEYFKSLFKGSHKPIQTVDPFINNLLFPEPTQTKIQQAEHLNNDISVTEVYNVLSKAADGKAPGIDGLPLEFLKHAHFTDEEGEHHHVLIEHITHVLNKTLHEKYLSSCDTSAIAPVLKSKGNPLNKDDHRGIAVGGALAKLYSLVLLKRFDQWAENCGMRARGQAGFRAGRGSDDAAFVLNHIIEKRASEGKPVYVAFIDFQKAYDSVNRDLLWKCLESMGVHGRSLDSLKEMYQQVKMAVRLGGQVGETFSADLGVKQGDPLSPLLFGLFIDRFESFLSELLPNEGVKIGSMLVQVLLYADDLALVAESPEQLQKMLDILHTFCVPNVLTVNIRKSVTVIFNSSFCQENHTFSYNGQALSNAKEFVYLGMLFSDNNSHKKGMGVTRSIIRNFEKGRKAYFAFIRRCYQMGIQNVGVKCHLFDSLVKPVIDYGCAIWGPYHVGINKFEGADQLGAINTMQLSFLRRALGVRQSTPTLSVMTELCREPMHLSWVRQITNFRNKIMQRPDNDIVKNAMIENDEMARNNKQCWASYFERFLKRHTQLDLHNDTLNPKSVTKIISDAWFQNLAKNRDKLSPGVDTPTKSWVRNIHDPPDGGSTKGFKEFTYSQWFAPDKEDKQSRFWLHLNCKKLIQVVAQFRLGSHWLKVETCRFVRPKVPRSSRVCSVCSFEDREDELHFMFCGCYHNIRTNSHFLFAESPDTNSHHIPWSPNIQRVSDSDVHKFFNPPRLWIWNHDRHKQYKKFWDAFAFYLIRCRDLRSSILELQNALVSQTEAGLV